MFGSVSATRFGIMNGTFEEGFPSPSTDEASWLFELYQKCLGVLDLEVCDEGHQFLTGGILRCPPLDRRDTIVCCDRLAIVRSRPSRSTNVYISLSADTSYRVDHLRFDFASRIRREQCIVDHIAVIAHDVGSRPDRIEDLEIRVHDNTQHFLRMGGYAKQGCRYHCRCSQGEVAGIAHLPFYLLFRFSLFARDKRWQYKQL